MKRLLILVAMLLVYPAAFAHDAGIIPVNMTLSGSILDVGIIMDGLDEKDLKLFELNMKGSPGKATARGVGWAGSPVPYAALPSGNECFDIPSSPVDGVLFEEFQMTMNFSDGSLLFANAVGGYLCFAPSVAIGTYEFNGGTGRFEGATGSVDLYIETYRFAKEGHPNLVTAETGTLIGEIILP